MRDDGIVLFFREGPQDIMFYPIDLMGTRLKDHIDLNPGTLKVTRVLTDEILYKDECYDQILRSDNYFGA